MSTQKIIYTKTDEAPALATYSLLPIIQSFLSTANIEVEVKDISLAARIIAQFPNYLSPEQQVEDALSELGAYTQDPEANLIKLPNISASIPQLLEAIEELQKQGFALPNYPSNPQTDAEKEIKAKYAKAIGSAVNPVLRDGNSDRRAPKSVKNYAQKNPHSMGDWPKNPETQKAISQSHVSSMHYGDFFGNERSKTIEKDMNVFIELTQGDNKEILKDNLSFKKGDIIDVTYMQKQQLREFITNQLDDAKEKGLLFSVHLKATMMKVSDPIIFGHFVDIFYKEALRKYSAELSEIGFTPNNGINDLYEKLDALDLEKAEEIKQAIQDIYTQRPDLAMVDSSKGITNLHMPNDIIIDASMPAALRTSGQMWNKEGKQQDTKFVIPDRSYAEMYQEFIDFCKEHGKPNVSKMGSVSNVGLMAQKAEEYGSHDKTFEIPFDGQICVRDKANPNGQIFSQYVKKGDIWRMCQVKDIAIRDWVRMAVVRARAVGCAVFWLDNSRAHDRELITKVKEYLQHHNTEGLDILILSPKYAMHHSLERAKDGLDTVSVTGNVLRDYLTDLFPIMELGTSAKMLSIVPLLKGGFLFETGAGGSAPKHVEQFTQENYLRWDSLGEFLALQVSLEELSTTHNNPKAKVLANTLDIAIEGYLDNKREPARKLHSIDNRGSHFYLALYWAQALAAQNDDTEIKSLFSSIAEQLATQESAIVQELNAVQGSAVSIGGYYNPDEQLCTQAMRPSALFNQIIDGLSS